MASGAANETEFSPPLDLEPAEVVARRWQLVATSLAVILIDQVTKAWALSALADERIDGPFGSALRLVFNRGSAFSLGEGFGPIFGVLAIIVSIGMVFVVGKVVQRSVVTGLGLIQGGAIGNVIDRAFREGDGFLGGAVIDFLEIGDFWPVFNIADVAIVVGGIVVAILGSRE